MTTGTTPGIFAGRTLWFAFRWMLTLTPPVFLPAIAQLLWLFVRGGMPVYMFAIVAPFAGWAATGVLQYWMLRHTPWNSRLWLAATAVGGSLGHGAGGLIQLLLQTHYDVTAAGDSKLVDLLYPLYQHVPLIIAGLGSAGILALAQSICFAATLRERIPWFLVSLFAGGIGSMAGAAAFQYSAAALLTAALFDSIPTAALPGIIYALTVKLVSCCVFGLITGICLQVLLARRLRLQHAGLLGKFD